MKQSLLSILFLLLPMLASADAVEINGIYYNFVTKAKEAEVTNNYPNYYSGEVVIPESVEYGGVTYSVTSIGGGAFSHCSGLTSITIPNSVTYIGEAAFIECTGLTLVTIGSGCNTVCSGAFAGCSGLTDLYCYAENVPETPSGGNFTSPFWGSNYKNATLHVPAVSVNDYMGSDSWGVFKSIVAIGSETPETQKCATPIISVVNGKVHFDCETEEVEFHYGFTNPIFANSVGNDMEIPSTYNLTVYATKDGYDNSDVATMEIHPTNSASSGKKGDVNGDDIVNAADIVKLVSIIMEE